MTFFDQNKDLILVFGITVAAFLVFYIFMQKNKTKTAEQKKAEKARRQEKLYKIYITTPLLKNYAKKCYYQLRKTAASNEHETRDYTVNCVTKGLLGALITGLGLTIVLENPISIALGWVAAYLMLTHVLRMESNRLNKKLLQYK